MRMTNKKAVTAATEHGKEMCVYNTIPNKNIVHALLENVKQKYPIHWKGV